MTISQEDSWIRARRDVDAVIIFIHGVNSAAASCWESKNSSWPLIVSGDSRFSAFDIYAPDYFTGIGSSDYGVADCASALMRKIQTSSTPHGRSLLEYKNIIFVAHSFGGIIARYILESQREKFFGKKIGLVLMASPSQGSLFADLLRIFTGLFPHKQRDELRSNSPLLEDLDVRFKRLIHSRKPEFELIGVEAYEQKRFLGLRIVSRRSAAPYFGEAVHIPKSTHSSIVKPVTKDDPSHQLLASFCEENFRRHFDRDVTQIIESASPSDLVLFDVYHPSCFPYYLGRDIDDLVDKTCQFRSIWLYGESGVGKTSVARKYFGLDLDKTLSIYLANCALPVSRNILDELAQAAKERNGSRDHLTEASGVAQELAAFGSKYGHIHIFIDEIPIGDDPGENETIISKVSHIMHELKTIAPQEKVLIVLASIKEPLIGVEMSSSKFSEYFHIMKVPAWKADEIFELATLIDASQAFAGQVEAAKIAEHDRPKTPRDLKSKVRDKLIQTAGQK